MRTLQAGLHLTDDGDKVIFRQFGGESSLRTLQSGHTVIRADQFDPDGWQLQLPAITELCQNNDEGCATNYMSVIAHVYQRPRCMDDDAPAGDHDPASTRSCRPRQKNTIERERTCEISSTNLPSSSPRFKSGKQMDGAFQNHERDIWSSSTIKSMPSSCTNASSMTTSAAVRLSTSSCLTSHPPCRFFCNDEVACQSRRSRFHCRYVYASVGPEKLGGGSCPNRGPTAVSSSTLSHCLAMVSSHAGLRHQLWIFRLRVLHKIDSVVIL